MTVEWDFPRPSRLYPAAQMYVVTLPILLFPAIPDNVLRSREYHPSKHKVSAGTTGPDEGGSAAEGRAPYNPR